MRGVGGLVLALALVAIVGVSGCSRQSNLIKTPSSIEITNLSIPESISQEGIFYVNITARSLYSGTGFYDIYIPWCIWSINVSDRNVTGKTIEKTEFKDQDYAYVNLYYNTERVDETVTIWSVCGGWNGSYIDWENNKIVGDVEDPILSEDVRNKLESMDVVKYLPSDEYFRYGGKIGISYNPATAKYADHVDDYPLGVVSRL